MEMVRAASDGGGRLFFKRKETPDTWAKRALFDALCSLLLIDRIRRPAAATTE
jgi:hypothetical protein